MKSTSQKGHDALVEIQLLDSNLELLLQHSDHKKVISLVIKKIEDLLEFQWKPSKMHPILKRWGLTKDSEFPTKKAEVDFLEKLQRAVYAQIDANDVCHWIHSVSKGCSKEDFLLMQEMLIMSCEKDLSTKAKQQPA